MQGPWNRNTHITGSQDENFKVRNLEQNLHAIQVSGLNLRTYCYGRGSTNFIPRCPTPPPARNLQRFLKNLKTGRLTYLLTYLLTLLHGAGYYLKSWLLFSSLKHIPLSYGTRRFITVITKAHHWTLSWASWIQFAPSIPISPRSILMKTGRQFLQFCESRPYISISRSESAHYLETSQGCP
jgi:hypothetical protein